MLIEVLYFAEIKDITGKEREKFDIHQNMNNLLQLLFEKYPSLRELICTKETHNFHNIISVIKNNQAIHERNPSLISLNDGDTIAFLLPVSGG